MRFPYWEPLDRLHIPEPITEAQTIAAATLEAAARMVGGFVEFHGDVERIGRAEEPAV